MEQNSLSDFTIVAFATKKSKYEEVLNNTLYPSINKFNLSYILTTTQDNGSWNKNVAEKPKIILDLFNQKLLDKLVLLDADASIEKYPSLFDEIPEEYDIAFHTLNWNEWYGYKQNPPVMELLTGTMFFRNRPEVRKLCQEWYEKAIKSNEWEQKVLQNIIKNYNLKIYPLPIEYCFINTMPNGSKPIVNVDPVIRHYQLSRETKRRNI